MIFIVMTIIQNLRIPMSSKLQECPEGLVWHTDEDEFGEGECDYPFNDPDCAEYP